MSTPESQSDDYFVFCPYCGNKYRWDSENFSEEDSEDECERCERTYLRCDSVSITPHTRPMEPQGGSEVQP